MPKGLTKLLHEYKSPSLILKFPRLIYLQFAAAWITTTRFWHVNKQLKRIIKSKKGNDLSILDIGCGSGELIFPRIVSNPNIRFTGVDRNENALRTAKVFKKFRKIENFDIQQGDIETFRGKQSFDVINVVSVLQYLDDVAAGLECLSKLLKTEGVMLLYIPINFTRVIPGYKYLVKNWFNDVDYNAKVISNELTESELELAVKDAGLNIEENYYVYGLAGKVAYEFISFGQLMIFKLPWLIAIVFALIYFPIILLPAWVLMGIDVIKSHKTGNGLMIKVSANKESR